MHSTLLTTLLILTQAILIRSLSSSSQPLTNILSIQLRALVYVFLRWIPASLLAPAIPSIFLIYSLACSRPLPRAEEESSNKARSSTPPSDEHPLEQKTQQDLTHVSESAPLLPAIERTTAISKRTTSRETRRLPADRAEQGVIRQTMNVLVGLRSPMRAYSKANKATYMVNLVLTLLSLDATLRTALMNGEDGLSFTRAAAVGETWVKIHARIPPPNVLPDRAPSDHPPPTGAHLVYRPMKSVGQWIPGPSLTTSYASDWTAVAKIDHLSPGQTYEYRLNSLQDPQKPHPLFESVGHFKTAPDTSEGARGGTFTFAYSSCIKPGFPYNPFRHPLHNDGADQLADFVRQFKTDFVLFLGDFIYADSPVYLGHAIQLYWRKYRQSFAAVGWRKVIQFTRTIHIYDDHEILNDWAGNGNDTNEIFEPANRAYSHYLGSGNYDGPGSGKNYYWFRYGDAGFFVWDCRRYRSPNEQLDDHSKTMLGLEQKNTFLDWLSAVNSTVTFKFVVSSTPFMTLWSGPDGGIDTWAGFLTERNELMNYMEFVPNVIVLSGDRHEFAAAIMRESVIEFSTSPLNQFWLPIRTLWKENGLGKTGEDRLMKYIPNGIHKFSTLNVDCRDPKKPAVHFKLYIDEKMSYELKYLGKPVKQEPQQLGHILPTWEQLLNFVPPIRWFSDSIGSLAVDHPTPALEPLTAQTPNPDHDQLL